MERSTSINTIFSRLRFVFHDKRTPRNAHVVVAGEGVDPDKHAHVGHVDVGSFG